MKITKHDGIVERPFWVGYVKNKGFLFFDRDPKKKNRGKK
jgi:hypothetical protein